MSTKSAQIIPKCRSKFKILDARKVPRHQLHTEGPLILGATVRNLMALATWRPEFMHSWFNIPRPSNFAHWKYFTLFFTLIIVITSKVIILQFYTNPRSRNLPEKLTGLQLVKKFAAFYGIQRSIITFPITSNLCLSWARSIYPMPLHLSSSRSKIYLSNVHQIQQLKFIVCGGLWINFPLLNSIKMGCHI